jgi:hypothetical protein
VVAPSTWQGGRERRRRIDDQLVATPRPQWQRALASWAAISLGVMAGLLLLWLSAVAFVAPTATYNSGGYWLTLGIAFMSLASAAAVGLAAGHLIPLRLVAPVAAVLAFFYMEALTNPGIPDSLIWLSPSNLSPYAERDTFHLESSLHVQQAMWIGGVGGAALVLAGARRKWLAVIPAVLAVLGASLLINGPGHERWQPDPMAQVLVCSDTIPDVCLTRVNAFLMDDLVPIVLEHFVAWDGVEGVPNRVIDGEWRDSNDTAVPPEDTVELHLRHFFAWNGGLTNPTSGGMMIEHSLAGSITSRPACDLRDLETLDFESEDPWAAIPPWREEAGIVAFGWAVRDPTAGSPVFDDQGNRLDPVPNPDTTRLLGLSDKEQKTWMSRYLSAARTCDDETFAALIGQLR